MDLSILLAKQIFTQFIMIIVGFTIVKLRLLRSDEASSISKVVLYIIVPCMIIDAFQIDYTQSVVKGLLIATVADLVINILFVVAAHFISKPFKLNAIEEGTMAYPNAGNLIYPLVGAVLGAESQIYCCPYFVLQLFFMFTILESKVCGIRKISWYRIMLNPNMIAIFFAVLMFIFRIKLPPTLGNVFKGFASMTAPASMLVIGMAIASCDFKRVFTTPKYYIITAMRLIVFPLAVILLIKVTGAAYWFDISKDILLIVLMPAASCAASTVTQFAQAYNYKAEEAGMLNMMTVVFVIITMPLMIGLYQLII